MNVVDLNNYVQPADRQKLAPLDPRHWYFGSAVFRAVLLTPTKAPDAMSPLPTPHSYSPSHEDFSCMECQVTLCGRFGRSVWHAQKPFTSDLCSLCEGSAAPVNACEPTQSLA